MRQKELNVLTVYNQATKDEMRAGLGWYFDANDEASRLADEHKLTMLQTAGIIAALSPGLRWENNIEAAERVIEGKALDGLHVRWYDGVRKAKRILKGHNPDVVLNGNKVKAFYACILNPDNEVTCCIDGHAFAIWQGRRVTIDNVPNLTDRLYHRIASSYVEVAKLVKISPCQLQAITWVTWRRIHAV